MTERRYFSGNSLEQAVMNAARHFKLDPEDLAYRQMEKKHGFVKTRRNVVIEVDPAQPRKPLSDEEAYRRAMKMDPEAHLGRDPNDRSYVTDEPAANKGSRKRSRRRKASRSGNGRRESKPQRDAGRPAEQRPVRKSKRDQRVEVSRPESETGRGNGDSRTDSQPEPSQDGEPRRVRVAEARPSRPQAEGPAAEAASEGMSRLLQLARLDLAAECYQGPERIEIELSGADEGLVTRRRGELLAALQQLVPTLVRTQTGERLFCRVDCDGFREIHEERLRDLAQRVAGKVDSSRRAQVLESMNPAERRIIHITLADDPAVSTESLGNGYFKRVRVSPS